ncbi:DUF4349 domain-containing protein [Actinacidiphila oryziradicis]|uniref:DUF4349 domain-containing protein n=1 Tax=Actinacidiphila oryziradicis TaxID=2571141 RepID=A0A4U0SAX3_9ACTN|nr:DUF4349 domain-containing protein [Actinacidiphila oryziradicis]TKA06456.1 DUF4349 domain-containing protein [Actinacidiphila oryziradicis]
MQRRPFAALAAVLITASLALAGCSGGSSSGGSADSKAAAGRQAAPAAAGTAGAGSTGSGTKTDSKTSSLAQSYIVRTATLTVQANNVADALAQARTLVAGAGGYVGDENTSLDSKGLQHSRLQLRVPPDTYDRVLGDLAGLGRLLGRTVSAQDVTEQVVDVQSRIKTQQASVARVRELMNRATKISDIVSLEGQLSTREADLESLQAQQASLKERTGMATVTLVLTEPAAKPASAKPKAADGFWASVGNALTGGWHAFYVALRGVLMALAAVLPFAALGLAGWFVYRAVRKRLPAHPEPHSDDT